MTDTDDTFNHGPMAKTPFDPERTRQRAWDGVMSPTQPGPTPRDPKNEAR